MNCTCRLYTNLYAVYSVYSSASSTTLALPFVTLWDRHAEVLIGQWSRASNSLFDSFVSRVFLLAFRLITKPPQSLLLLSSLRECKWCCHFAQSLGLLWTSGTDRVRCHWLDGVDTDDKGKSERGNRKEERRNNDDWIQGRSKALDWIGLAGEVSACTPGNRPALLK